MGKRLAGRMGKRFVDIDDLVEESHGASIREIVESGGMGTFPGEEKSNYPRNFPAERLNYCSRRGGGAGPGKCEVFEK